MSWRCVIEPTSEHSEHVFSVVSPSSETRVRGKRAAMKRAAEASRRSGGCVEVVRDDGRLTMIFWEGSLQGYVYKRTKLPEQPA
jgi:hypothetical protein